MKTFGISSKLLSASVLLSFAVSIALAAPQPGKAVVTGVKGSASVGGEPAHVNVSVPAGAIVSTDANSQLDLYLGVNGPNVTLLSDSRLSVDELSYDNAGAETVITTRLGLKQGKVQGYVKKTSEQSSYRVETPTSTASIRGTKYMVAVDGSVYVWEGCVNVAFRGINYNVCAGQAFDPKAPGVIENPYPASTYVGPVGEAGINAPKPVGPLQPISPIAPGLRTQDARSASNNRE